MRFTTYPPARRKLLMARRNVGLKIIQKRFVSPSQVIDGIQFVLFQCIDSSNAKPETNISNPTGRIPGENLRTGMFPANNATYSPTNIRRRAGRMLTNKALEAAEGEDGTVRNEMLKNRIPIPPRILPIF
jgi:hypothetical protein